MLDNWWENEEDADRLNILTLTNILESEDIHLVNIVRKLGKLQTSQTVHKNPSSQPRVETEPTSTRSDSPWIDDHSYPMDTDPLGQAIIINIMDVMDEPAM